MSRFIDRNTGVVFSVADSKDSRYAGDRYGDLDAQEPSKYEGLKVAELKAEIARRNEGRDEDSRVPSEGAKPDLVKALDADDAK